MTDLRVENPAGDMRRELREGVTDFALMWGPIAGPMAKEFPELKVTPLVEETGTPRLFFRITMGVRRGEPHWKDWINDFIDRHQEEINAILADYGVPLLDPRGRPLAVEGGGET